MEDILINWSPQETRVAVVEGGAVQELHIERTLERGLVGNVYLGKVVRVLPGMQSAFIDIGLERAAFLHVADLHSAAQFGHGRHHGTHGDAPPTPIERLVFEGQPLMVQVIKDPIGTKGARLSTQVSIAGRTLVYLPQDPHIGISQRIEGEVDREALRARVQGLVPADERGGFIVRTIAEEASDETRCRTLVDRRRRTRLFHPPLPHDHHMIGHAHGLGLVHLHAAQLFDERRVEGDVTLRVGHATGNRHVAGLATADVIGTSVTSGETQDVMKMSGGKRGGDIRGETQVGKVCVPPMVFQMIAHRTTPQPNLL